MRLSGKIAIITGSATGLQGSVMGFGGAPRYAINDTKPNSDDETIFAITVKRNVGIENIKI